MSKKLSSLLAIPLFLSSALAMEEEKQGASKAPTKLKIMLRVNNPVNPISQVDRASDIIPIVQTSVLQIDPNSEFEIRKNGSAANGQILATNKTISNKRPRKDFDLTIENEGESSSENEIDFNSKKQKTISFGNSNLRITNDKIHLQDNTESDDSHSDFENNNNNNNQFGINIEDDQIEPLDSKIIEEKNGVDLFPELESKEINFFSDIAKYLGIDDWNIDFNRERVIIKIGNKKHMPKFSDITKIKGLKNFYQRILCEESFDDCFPNKIFQITKAKIQKWDDSIKVLLDVSTDAISEDLRKYVEGFTCRVIGLRLFKELCDRNYQISVNSKKYPANNPQFIPILGSRLAMFVYSANSARKKSKTFTDNSLTECVSKFISIDNYINSIEDEQVINHIEQQAPNVLNQPNPQFQQQIPINVEQIQLPQQPNQLIPQVQQQRFQFPLFVGQFPPTQQQQQQLQLQLQRQNHMIPQLQQHPHQVTPQMQQLQNELNQAKEKINNQEMLIKQYELRIRQQNTVIGTLKQEVERHKSAENKPMDTNVQMMYS